MGVYQFLYALGGIFAGSYLSEVVNSISGLSSGYYF